MHKLLPVRIVAAAALVGSVGFAIAMPGGIAAAGGPKPPVTTVCSSLFGNATTQVLSGCTIGKGKNTAYGVTVPNSNDTGATIYWTDKDTTIESFSYTPITNTCPTYLGVSASLEESEVGTITGGNTKLAENTPSPAADVCVYLGANSTTLVVGGSTQLG